jgi:hypothetical protein
VSVRPVGQAVLDHGRDRRGCCTTIVFWQFTDDGIRIGGRS